MPAMYRSLDAQKIADTVRILRDRIVQRFPESGLGRVAGELLDVANESVDRYQWVSRSILWLRVGVWALVGLMLAVLVAGLYGLNLPAKVSDLAGLVQLLDAGINDIILIGAAIFFLVTLETRLKRKVVMKALHELRSLAHIVDTHQLTKHPERHLCAGTDTVSSPKRDLTAFEMSRYLNYCTEMLSLIGKLAALYVQRFDDPVTLEAVDDIEDLTTGLARKVWQKISMLGAAVPGPAEASLATPDTEV